MTQADAGRSAGISRCNGRALLAAAMVLAGLCACTGPGSDAQSFSSPGAAVEALVAATRADQSDEIVNILGPEGRKLVYSGDPVADNAGRDRFVAAYDQSHTIQLEGDTKAVLVLGDRHWPFPIPVVRASNGNWHFDTPAGEQEILDRRIGRNELNAIKVCRAIVDAQRDYAERIHQSDGIVEYARKFSSSPGQRDGLYWPAAAGEAESPIGPLLAQAQAEGYGDKPEPGRLEPYHGYYYRLLMAQGGNAPDGAYAYVVDGHMIGGFALVAFPARYGSSGIMSFIVNQDGVVYQKNLGPGTAELAEQMQSFDPDPSWKKTVD